MHLQSKAKDLREGLAPDVDNFGMKRNIQFRKTSATMEEFVQDLFSIQKSFIENEVKDVLRKLWEDPHIKILLPDFMQDVKDTEQNCNFSIVRKMLSNE